MFTTVITAYQLACTITKKNFSGFTVADSGDNTGTIFEDKAKFVLEQLPNKIKPSQKFNNRRELLFSNLNSKWRCATAGNKELGRSKTINFFHGSEAAFWDSIQSIFKGLGQALTKDSIQILETTANGFNEYRTLWAEAESKENNWTPLFFEWWRTPEYRLKFESKEEEISFKKRVNEPQTEFEKTLNWLLKDKKLDWEQLYWYNSKERDLKGDIAQEFPNTPDEAFLASGTPVFDNSKVIKRKDFLTQLYKKQEPIVGRFSYEYKNEKIIANSIKFIEDLNGPIIIYNKPKPGYPYVLGGDTAEGGTDFCVGQVLDNTTGKQVAKFRQRLDTDLFAKQMYCLGYFYNWALISIETNFDLHPVKELDRLGYPNQYLREHMDSITGDVAWKHGFNTNKATRPVIIGDLVTIVRESTHLIQDIDTLKEMITFIKNDQGRAEAAEGEHDDCVLSLAIAHKSRSQQRFTVKLDTAEEERIIFPLTPGATEDKEAAKKLKVVKEDKKREDSKFDGECEVW